jgi:ABC-type cobalamin/Fe3+-siderophores transport system ATPase subunit
MPIKEVVVNELFGSLNHTVPVHQEGLTFLFGLNGSGKTTTLQLLDALFKQRLSAVLRVPFHSLSVRLTSDEVLYVHRVRTDDDLHESDYKLVFSTSGDERWEFAKSRAERPVSVSWVSSHYPDLRRVGPRMWEDRRTGRRFSYSEIVHEFDDVPFAYVPQPDAPLWLTRFLEAESTFFIPADRLHSPIVGSNRDRSLADEDKQTVESYAADLVEKLKFALADYGEFSQYLESSFPGRFLALAPAEDVSLQELQKTVEKRYVEQSHLRARYERAGLLEPGEALELPEEFDLDKLQFLAAYLDDVDEKLARLSSIAQRLELFLDIINSKLRRKQIAVDRKAGLRVVGTNERLSLGSLSSGEQQEIVLTYGLLFLEQPGTLVLIDEPELSLHVAWQFQLIPDMLRIAELANLTFLIATHSPQVVNGRDDITVFLRDDEE